MVKDLSLQFKDKAYSIGGVTGYMLLTLHHAMQDMNEVLDSTVVIVIFYWLNVLSLDILHTSGL